MQDPNRDTEWNDALRAKGIIPPRETELTEEDLVQMVDKTIEDKTTGKSFEDMKLGELDELEDEIDEEEERLFEMYRKQRMQEMMAAQQAAKYGDVREISREDYVREVNKAGEGVWVVLHVYKPSMPICKIINEHLYQLARKFPATKYLKSVSSVCIPNYPDKNLPTVFVYFEGELKKQFVGPHVFGGTNITKDELEWMLSETGAVKTDLEENPHKQVQDVMSMAVRNATANDSDDDNDW